MGGARRAARVMTACALVLCVGLAGCRSVPEPPSRPTHARVHTVSKGETLWKISKRYGTSVREIQRMNRLNTDGIRPGQRLYLPVPKRTHVVRSGDTLWSIAQRYGSSVSALVRANRLSDSRYLKIGQSLTVPVLRAVPAQRPAATARVWTRSDPRGRSAGKPTRFLWPVRGPLMRNFGMRSGASHDGIDISAGQGVKVVATAAGRVIHADDSLAGYGNLIILKHAGKLSSIYAHNQEILVRVGDFVDQGQTIARVGKTGRASAPQLHFEIRQDGRARDPLKYLP